MSWNNPQKNSSSFSNAPKQDSDFSNPGKNSSSFVDSIKQALISFLLWTDDTGESQGYLMYTDEFGGEGRIILEDQSFANLQKHPALYQNQNKFS